MKRRFEFTLRSLLLLVTLMCLWLGYRSSAIRHEEKAIDAIREANGFVDYGAPWGFRGIIRSGDCTNRPKWMRILVGDGPYDTVGVVYLHEGYSRQVGCDDALLAELLPHLKRLRDLKSLDLDGSQRVSSTGVELLAQLSSLEVLNLCNTSADDAAIDSLVKLRRLKHLDIVGTEISDQGVARLHRALPDCQIRYDCR